MSDCCSNCGASITVPVGPIGPQGPQGLQGAQGIQGNPGPAIPTKIVKDFSTGSTNGNLPLIAGTGQVAFGSALMSSYTLPLIQTGTDLVPPYYPEESTSGSFYCLDNAITVWVETLAGTWITLPKDYWYSEVIALSDLYINFANIGATINVAGSAIPINGGPTSVSTRIVLNR